MRIKNPKTSEIAYIEDKFNLTDAEGNIIKTISLDELKNWQKYEEDVDLDSSEIQFIESCLENLYESRFKNITHILRDGISLVFCTYEDGKIVYVENIQVIGFNRMEQGVVYSLKELGVAGSLWVFTFLKNVVWWIWTEWENEAYLFSVLPSYADKRFTRGLLRTP